MVSRLHTLVELFGEMERNRVLREDRTTDDKLEKGKIFPNEMGHLDGNPKP